MRLFTAIDLPHEVRDALAAVLNRLRPLAKLRWTAPEKMHVTVKFVGEWPEERLNELNRALAEVPASGPIDVSVRRVGWLPNPRSARVLYAGVEASPSLAALASATERALEPIGIAAEDRIFRPHVTLARTRDRVPLGALKSALREVELNSFGDYRASSFFLYSSADGSYTKLQEFRLLNS
jgi:RNA 2',3'-cyclic 3'-phosphodiesterase